MECLNYYSRYLLIDNFMRTEDRLLNLKPKIPFNLHMILECNNIDVDGDAKFLEDEESTTIIIVSDKIYAKEYIQYKGKEYTVIILPKSIREDDFDFTKKVQILFKVASPGSYLNFKNKGSIANLQERIIPFLIVTRIMSDIYAPFDEVAKKIVDTLLDNNLINIKEDMQDILDIMNYINDLDTDQLLLLFNYSSIFSIANKEFIISIIHRFRI